MRLPVKLLYFLAISFLFFSATAVLHAQRPVLTFNGDFKQHVNHGEFWEIYTPQNPQTLSNEFAWEAWVKIDERLQHGYWISSGYGGAHAILAGFIKGPNNRYSAVGNAYAVLGPCSAGNENATVNSFYSEEVFYPKIWYHIAVATKNNVMTIYKNGIPISSQTFNGQRVSSSCSFVDVTAGTLFIGGSDHINFTGLIASVRGWEGYSPYNGNPFVPEYSFRADLIEYPSRTKRYASFLADYTVPGLMVQDLSNGYNSKKHPGHLHSAAFLLDGAGIVRRSGAIFPKWTESKDFPVWAEQYQAEPNQAPATPPAGAIIFDSFNRPEVNLASDNLTLGATELGNKAWSAFPATGFGIQANKAVYLSSSFYGTNLIETGLADSRVCVGVTPGKNSGIAIRATSETNYIGLVYEGNTLSMLRVTPMGGIPIGVSIINGVTSLCLEAQGDNIKGIANQGVVFNVNEPTMTGTKAGLFVLTPVPVTTFENFAVYPVNAVK
jgi:hypothetical protein